MSGTYLSLRARVDSFWHRVTLRNDRARDADWKALADALHNQTVPEGESESIADQVHALVKQLAAAHHPDAITTLVEQIEDAAGIGPAETVLDETDARRLGHELGEAADLTWSARTRRDTTAAVPQQHRRTA